MSTRTRIVLRCPGFEATGPFAVKKLIQLANPKGPMGFQFPPAWNKMSKREKLAWLAGKLPAQYKLELFQEPRGTRIKQSLYHASLAVKKQKRRHPQADRNKIGWNYGKAPIRKPVDWYGNPVVQPVQPLPPNPNQRGLLAVDLEALRAFPDAPVAFVDDVGEKRVYREFEEQHLIDEEI